MKTGFKDRTEITEKKSPNPWNFDQPDYDERSSCFINAGTHYGVGKAQPVGKITASDKSPIPTGVHVKMETDYIDRNPKSNLDISEH